MRSRAGSVTIASSSKGVDCAAVRALCFADGMGFTEGTLDRENIVKHHNDGPTVNTKVTYGPTIVPVLAPKPAKTFHDCSENIFISYIFRRF